jgi:hypothetical protein
MSLSRRFDFDGIIAVVSEFAMQGIIGSCESNDAGVRMVWGFCS